ncbi:MAG: rRNA maturation RNase YbeY [Eubacteriales bacterium]|nr:rRNA maturation RNase YbeY [Eubacteriales bacterium]
MLNIDLDYEGFEAQTEPLVDALRTALCRAALEGAPEKARVGITVVDDEEIHRLNLEYRGVDRATDVLSFPMIEYPAGQVAKDVNWADYTLDADPETGEILLGDIVISLPTAQRQAEEYGHPLSRELTYLAVHGLAHLLGYDHETEEDKAKMRACEETALAAAGLSREEA